MKIKIKEVLFTVVAWGVLLWGINFLCGFIAGNRYIAVDGIDAKTARSSWGFFAPNQDKILLFPGLHEYRVRINSMGFRTTGGDPTAAELENSYRILTLGDSLTFGLFVNDEDSYPYRLQTLLREGKKNAVVLNAGVGGGVQSDYLYYLKVKGLKLKPDLVVISFCENDLKEMDKGPLYELIQRDSAFSMARTLKLMKIMRVFRKIELTYRYKHWLRKIKDSRERDILKHESKSIDDILYVQKNQGGLPATDPGDPRLKDDWEINFKVMREIVALLRQEKIDVIFLFYPNIVNVFDRARVNYQDILGDFLNGLQVEVVDPLPVFKAHRAEYLNLYNNLPRDFHLSGFGNQILAEEIYKTIKDRIK